MRIEILKGLIIFVLVMTALGVLICIADSSENTEVTPTENIEPTPTSVPTTKPTIAPTTSPTKPIETTKLTEPTQSTEPTESTKSQKELFEEEWGLSAQYLAKTLWGEARGCSEVEQRKVVWCILNRVDNPRFGNDIISVITAPTQFYGFRYSNPIWEELYQLALEVIYLWQLEKNGEEVQRELDKEYLFFSANSSGTGHYFRKEY